METLTPRQTSLLEDLLLIDDPQARLEVLVQRASRESLSEAEKSPERLVPGCVSQVWIAMDLRQGLRWFRCDADSSVVKGLAGLACEFYSGCRAEEVAEIEPQFIARLRLERQISPTRLRGLSHVVERIRQLSREGSP